MPQISSFQKHTVQYEKWFDENKCVYEAELNALKSLLPSGERGIEIGVGTGRFAAPLGVKFGVEPASRMRVIAQQRGVQVIGGLAEQLPLKNSGFSYALMVTVVCFLNNVSKAFQEAHRILKKDGYFIVALIDRNSPVGQVYSAQKRQSVFYKEAVFYSVDEIVELMQRSGFDDFQFRQTLFQNVSGTTANEPVLPGYGKGSFVAVRSKKHQRKDPSTII